MVRSCSDIPVDSNNLILYLRNKKCGIKMRTRPFEEIERDVACAIIDIRKNTMEQSPATLMDTGYDAGCADVARIPLILLIDEESKAPDDWFICEHVYKANIDTIRDVVDIFVVSVLKYQKAFGIAKRADIVARRELRQEVINMINKSIDKVSEFIKEKRGEL